MQMAYDVLKLEKGMYGREKSFTSVLEELDPSDRYKGTALEGLDAYQRQLKRFDIKVKGPGGDVVEKFFKTADSAALFPEYVTRA
ncbi:MAG TPA: phage major capsid protein, partial [Clostridiales bacterium]|nr:phage major capsid protein [Clostridiales bacterium]